MSTTKKVTAAAWRAKATHEITLPSGMEIVIRIPDISAMIETGELPQHLLDEAIKQLKAARDGGDEADSMNADAAAKEREYKAALILKTVVEPALTLADLDPKDGIPTEDRDMIVEFATRQREFDAVGNHIGGLDSSEKFRRFRGIESLYENVEGV